MNRSSFLTAALAASLLPALPGQSMTGPLQGLTFDSPSGSLRSVVGSYGSAVLGPALLRGLDFASVAPQRTRAIACEQGQCFLVDGLGTDTIARTAIGDQLDTPDGAAWSTDGTVAAIYSRSGQWVRVLRFAGESGVQQGIAAFGTLTDVEISPEGRVLFATSGDPSGVFEIQSAGNIVPVLSAAHPVALVSGGTTLYILDGSLVRTLGADGQTASWSLDGVENPVSLQTGRDASGRNVVYVAGGTDRTLFVYDAASHALLERVEHTCTPGKIQATGTDS